MAAPRLFTSVILTHNRHLVSLSDGSIGITSHDLRIADVVAVARHLTKVKLTNTTIVQMAESSAVVRRKLAEGEAIYGVNTGFGGSADTRTANVIDLQQTLFTSQMCGILAPTQTLEHQSIGVFGLGSFSDMMMQPAGQEDTNKAPPRRGFAITLPLNDAEAATSMPESWVRASMVIRLNSLAAGVSGIRVCIAESLVELLNEDLVPQVPLRGSISASGDLSPLSYVGAVMQGKPTAKAFMGRRNMGEIRPPIRADVALYHSGIKPVDIQPKEGLSIINGTSVSAGVAVLAVHECMNLAALSQVLTAMTVEALCGSNESFDPFVGRVRPHPGQVDCASNIFAFLKDSNLTTGHEALAGNGQLRQDRYSTRTASQWVGPVLEDFMLAYEQILTELNSVTDNPLVDVEKDRILHAGNFQARAITSATEKLRLGLQSLGRMLFSQCTELINPATSNGLPPNIVSEDPAESFLFKGVDIMVAALSSELGFLANPVGTHIHTAEMGNQSFNSLALISARYAMEAADVLSQLAAAHLVAVCQALDLRVRQHEKTSVPNTWAHLGKGTKKMYRYVRRELGVPFTSEAHFSRRGQVEGESGVYPSLGDYNLTVYKAIRSGALYSVVMECLEQAVQEDGRVGI